MSLIGYLLVGFIAFLFTGTLLSAFVTAIVIDCLMHVYVKIRLKFEQ